jgi:hypothetical protein
MRMSGLRAGIELIVSASLSWGVVLLLAVLAVTAWGVSPAPRVHAQIGLVGAEDISTPVATGVPLPTPTSTPPGTAETETTVITGTTDTDSSFYGHDLPDTNYTVREGDTLWTVALEMGVDLDVMPCIVGPYYRQDIPLVIGDVLASPAGELICHVVSEGDTISSIALEHGVDPESIVNDGWNQFRPGSSVDSPLEPGRYVRMLIKSAVAPSQGFFAYMLGRPIDQPPMMALARGGPVQAQVDPLVPLDWPYGSGFFEWPSPGWITQGYRNDHRALDIAAPLGTPVIAADRGVVIRSGWNSQGYGLFVVIDHNIDYVTLYSHLQDVEVAVGDVVAKGQVLGTVGSSGNSTGPHLHFEVRDFGSRINPLEVLLR